MGNTNERLLPQKPGLSLQLGGLYSKQILEETPPCWTTWGHTTRRALGEPEE